MTRTTIARSLAAACAVLLFAHGWEDEAQAARREKALRVRTIRPSRRKARVDPMTQVVISFSEPIDESSVRMNVDLRILFGKGVGWSFTAKGKRLVLYPTLPLEPATQYEIEVRPGLLSTSGRTLKRRKASIFFTAARGGSATFSEAQLVDLTAKMIERRAGHTADRVAGGAILLAGGETGEVVTDVGAVPFYATGAEIFVPAQQRFFAVQNPLPGPRARQASADRNGHVWLVGGRDAAGPLATTALVESTGLSIAAGPSLVEPRESPAVVTTASGVLLVVGGTQRAGSTTVVSATAEVLDPVTNRFRRTLHDPVRARAGATLTLLPDGRVLLVGGTPLGSGFEPAGEIFDPVTETFTETTVAQEHRQFGTTTSLGGGRVVVLDGGSVKVEVYDAVTGQWSIGCGESAPGRARAGTATLPDGGILVVGGFDAGRIPIVRLDSMELYVPSAGEAGQILPVTPKLSTPRALHTVTALDNGAILIAGGAGPGGGANLDTATLFVPPQSFAK